MSGSDQSRNLGGMLSQIGTTIGSQGESYRQNLAQNITNISRPELNLEDPESMQRYMQWAVGTGAMTEGQATQMQWQIQKLRESQEAKASADGSRGLMNAFSAMNKQRDQIATNRESMAGAGHDVTKWDANIATLDQNLETLRQAISLDPVASDALWQQETREYTMAQRAAEMKEQEAAAALLQQEEQFNKMSNGFTAMITSGQIDPMSEEGKAMMEQMALQRPEVHEDVLNRVNNFTKSQESLEKAFGEKGITKLTEKHFEDFANPESAYRSYKKFYDHNPRQANKEAYANLSKALSTAVATGKDKPDEAAFKWDANMATTAKQQATGSIEYAIAEAGKARKAAKAGLDAETSFFGFGEDDKKVAEARAAHNAALARAEYLRPYSEKDRKGAFTAQAKALRESVAADAVNNLRVKGVKPTQEAIRKEVLRLIDAGAGAAAQTPTLTAPVVPPSGRNFEAEYE